MKARVIRMNVKPAEKTRILVIAAVEVEGQAILRGLSGDTRFDVRVSGAGVGMAAACAAAVLVSGTYALAVSAGIGGGFADLAPVGSLVIADAIIAADLGAETPEDFRTAEELGFGENSMSADAALAGRLQEVLARQRPSLKVHAGPVLTVATATGTAATAEKWKRRHPLAAAEGMEGFGVACAARQHGVPCMELRGISNAVGPRDRAAWRIGDALAVLEQAFGGLKEALEPMIQL